MSRTQVVYLTFDRLWNLARETLAPVWSLSKFFYINNFYYKITTKDLILKVLWNEDPMGLRLNMAVLRFWMCRASADDQSLDIPSRIGWILGNSIRPVQKPRFRGPKSINQSTGAPIIRRPNIRTSYPLHGSFHPLVFQEDFRQINRSQSVEMKIWCYREICQIYATRDICWYRFGY